MHIAVLSASHAPQYRELMLEAYDQAPDAFTSTAEERQAEPMSWWLDRIGSASGLSMSFGAFVSDVLIGSVTLEFSAKPKTRHSALLIGMYVKADFRRSGVSGELMRAAIAAAEATAGLRSLRLSVTEGNAPALRLYRSFGFVTWGIEPESIRTPAGYLGKIYMSKQLAGAEDSA